jgi:hypothetical protein
MCTSNPLENPHNLKFQSSDTDVYGNTSTLTASKEVEVPVYFTEVILGELRLPYGEVKQVVIEEIPNPRFVGARTDYSQEYRNKLDAIFSVSEEHMGLDHISRDKKPLIDSVKSAITAASQSTSQDRYELIKRLKIDIVHSEMTYYAEDGTPYISPVCVSCNGTLYNGRRSLDDAIDDIISDLTTIGGSLC